MSARPDPTPANPFEAARSGFAGQGCRPFAFQEPWAAYARGDSGLVHAPTGMGKTYAAGVPPLLPGPDGAPGQAPHLSLLWITPLRALAGGAGSARRADGRAAGSGGRDPRAGDLAVTASGNRLHCDPPTKV